MGCAGSSRMPIGEESRSSRQHPDQPVDRKYHNYNNHDNANDVLWRLRNVPQEVEYEAYDQAEDQNVYQCVK